MRRLPSKPRQVNAAWILSANFAADLDCSVRLLGLRDCEDLAGAELDTMRYRICHLPAQLARHARTHKIARAWP